MLVLIGDRLIIFFCVRNQPRPSSLSVYIAEKMTQLWKAVLMNVHFDILLSPAESAITAFLF